MYQNQLNDNSEEQLLVTFLIEDRLERLRKKNITDGNLEDSLMLLLEEVRNEQFNWSKRIEIEQKIRELYATTAGLLASQDWQSPSFIDSGRHQAGTQHGKIKQSINDYKRDQHLDAVWYEERFRKEYISYNFFKPVRIFATSSGMAAFTTILGFLQGEKIIEHNTIAVGKHSYFENVLILKKLFSNQLVSFDENNPEEIASLVKEKQPAVWFLDTLCNDSTLTLPDLKTFFSLVKKDDPFIVLDNTCVSLLCQPFVMPHRPKNLIVWESLLKYHQFGLDRVNGGIVYAQCHNASELYTYRDHLGTNISDYAIHALPAPNKALLRSRLLRQQRNQQLFATILRSYIQEKNLTTTKIVTQTLGSHIVITTTIKPPVPIYNRWLQRTIKICKKNKLQAIGGTSFGFSTTRFYVPASRPGKGTPFFRISVGTEPEAVIQKLAEACCEALSG
jgi:cystathionine beta-lyase/cystathionine gamma-synthase